MQSQMFCLICFRVAFGQAVRTWVWGQLPDKKAGLMLLIPLEDHTARLCSVTSLRSPKHKSTLDTPHLSLLMQVPQPRKLGPRPVLMTFERPTAVDEVCCKGSASRKSRQVVLVSSQLVVRSS